MSDKLVQVGEKATLEMIDSGHVPSAAFHRAAIKAARAAGLSDADIAALYEQTPASSTESDMEGVAIGGPVARRS
jgi:hypothetical protein